MPTIHVASRRQKEDANRHDGLVRKDTIWMRRNCKASNSLKVSRVRQGASTAGRVSEVKAPRRGGEAESITRYTWQSSRKMIRMLSNRFSSAVQNQELTHCLREIYWTKPNRKIERKQIVMWSCLPGYERVTFQNRFRSTSGAAAQHEPHIAVMRLCPRAPQLRQSRGSEGTWRWALVDRPGIR